MTGKPKVLIIGSAPDATKARELDLTFFDKVIVINNAWNIVSIIFSFYYPKRSVYPESEDEKCGFFSRSRFSEMNEEKYTDALHLHALALSSQNLLGSSPGDVCTLFL